MIVEFDINQDESSVEEEKPQRKKKVTNSRDKRFFYNDFSFELRNYDLSFFIDKYGKDEFNNLFANYEDEGKLTSTMIVCSRRINFDAQVYQILEHCITNGINLRTSCLDYKGRNLMYYLIESRLCKCMKLVLTFDQVDVNIVFPNGKPLLFHAVEKGSIDQIITLFNFCKDLNVNITNHKGHNALSALMQPKYERQTDSLKKIEQLLSFGIKTKVILASGEEHDYVQQAQSLGLWNTFAILLPNDYLDIKNLPLTDDELEIYNQNKEYLLVDTRKRGLDSILNLNYIDHYSDVPYGLKCIMRRILNYNQLINIQLSMKESGMNTEEIKQAITELQIRNN